MNSININATTELLGSIAGMSASMLSVAVTIVVFVPAFIEIARDKSPDYLSGEEQKRIIRHAFLILNIVIIIFTAALILGLIGMLFPKLWLFASCTSLLLLGVLFLIYSTIRLSRIVIRSLF